MGYPISCIYKIICNDGRYYIGFTVDYNKRKHRHIRELKNNKHHNKHLQNIYHKHGINFLLFKILREIPRNELCKHETETILQHFDDIKCINILASSTYGNTLSNHPNKQKIVSKRSESFRSMFNSLSLDERKDMYGRFGNNNGSHKRKRTKEELEVCSKYGKKGAEIIKKNTSGKKFEELYGFDKAHEMKSKLSEIAKQRFNKPENNTFYNKKHSEESKIKQSEAHVGIFNKTQAKPISINGIIYISIRHAHVVAGISAATIIFRLRSKSDKFSGYLYLNHEETKKVINNYKKYDITNIYK